MLLTFYLSVVILKEPIFTSEILKHSPVSNWLDLFLTWYLMVSKIIMVRQHLGDPSENLYILSHQIE